MIKVHASLFSGFGAAELAATWMGWNNAFWCEIEDFPRTVLSYWFPQSIGYGNIKETDFTPWHGKVDILTGGFPCQPFSVAGQRKGTDDDRYLWPEMLRAIREIRPTWIIGENVNGILSMVQPGNEFTVESQASLFEENDKETILEQEYVVETICRSIEQEGYSVQPIVIPACSVEAPHIRYRVFFIAHCSDTRVESMQREGKNRIYQSEHITNSKCKGADKYSKKYNPNSQMGTALAALAMNGMLPTPKANSWKTPCEHGDGALDLQTYIANVTGEISRLNPLFVEEMMGFPLMWCALPFLSQHGALVQSKGMETQ